MIDDEVVKAKKEAAQEMAVASGIEYIMYPGSVITSTHILESDIATDNELQQLSLFEKNNNI
ncbi:predicted hydrolase [Clostridium sp. SY8519]|uniref:hypothetical protein n=1 Tax=Clostridium sp. (strain SY8519) TaxID=1042156 RepID=UPI00021722B5|nr:hypothetical protein [Clostridium sp. SY8519]BAK48483.1 predicted hydrolase [Clostridium sp. SY8519]